MIAARIVKDSIAPNGVRLTTFVLTFPRIILPQFLTHRAFSRNTASSRAIPCFKFRKLVWNEPAKPIYWAKNKKGMSAEEELTGMRLFLAKTLWGAGVLFMLGLHWCLEKTGLHKQVANRVLDTFFNVSIIVTATEWANFYALRNADDAQQEIRVLAEAMLNEHNNSIPRRLGPGQWHLPYVEDDELKELGLGKAIKLSVARCGRISYLNHEGKMATFEENMAMYDKLVGSFPLHASPAEHQATPMASKEFSGNLRGWCQNRKLLSNENVTEYKGLK